MATLGQELAVRSKDWFTFPEAAADHRIGQAEERRVHALCEEVVSAVPPASDTSMAAAASECFIRAARMAAHLLPLPRTNDQGTEGGRADRTPGRRNRAHSGEPVRGSPAVRGATPSPVPGAGTPSPSCP